MWILYAFLSAFFSGITAILAKIGIKNTSSNIANAIRCIVILFFSWFIVFITNSFVGYVTYKDIFFLFVSGISTGLSWIFYFKALEVGDINKVTPIDKSSIILTMVLGIVFLNESFTLLKLFAMIFIGLGTFLMIEKKDGDNKKAVNSKWFLYAVLSAVFAALTSILGKVGVSDINSNLGSAIRTVIVLIMSFIFIVYTGEIKDIKRVSFRDNIFICLSGISTGCSWLFYYAALKLGEVSIVISIDKLSIVVTILFSYFILKEKLNFKYFIGLIFILIGTLSLVLL